MPTGSENSLAASLELVARLVDGAGIGPTVAAVERRLEGETRAQLLAEEDLGDELLRGAMAVTRAIGDLYALVHAAGMIAAMRVILDDDERIESLSLGAGATGKPDLVTNNRVAEFKFQRWTGNDGARQRELVADVIRLAIDASGRPRCLYLLDKTRPLRWLGNSTRNLKSLLGSTRHAPLLDDVARVYGSVETVAELWRLIDPPITVVGLTEVSPVFVDTVIDAVEPPPID